MDENAYQSHLNGKRHKKQMQKKSEKGLRAEIQNKKTPVKSLNMEVVEAATPVESKKICSRHHRIGNEGHLGVAQRQN